MRVRLYGLDAPESAQRCRAAPPPVDSKQLSPHDTLRVAERRETLRKHFVGAAFPTPDRSWLSSLSVPVPSICSIAMIIGPCLFAASIASRHECGRNFRRDPASRLSDSANVWIEEERLTMTQPALPHVIARLRPPTCAARRYRLCPIISIPAR